MDLDLGLAFALVGEAGISNVPSACGTPSSSLTRTTRASPHGTLAHQRPASDSGFLIEPEQSPKPRQPIVQSHKHWAAIMRPACIWRSRTINS